VTVKLNTLERRYGRIGRLTRSQFPSALSVDVKVGIQSIQGEVRVVLKRLRQLDNTSRKGISLWLRYCRKHITVQRQGDNFKVVGCKHERECYGCYPRVELPFDPKDVEEWKDVANSMQVVSQNDLVGYFIKPIAMLRLVEPYEEKEGIWYWFHHIGGNDLHTVTVIKVKDK